MTSTPSEPLPEPDIQPSGDPIPVEPNDPGTTPDGPGPTPTDRESDPVEQPGQMPESADPDIGA